MTDTDHLVGEFLHTQMPSQRRRQDQPRATTA